MKFKGSYTNGRQDISLGSFYTSDVRKLVNLRRHYPFMFADQYGEPRPYFTERVQANDSLFFTAKWRKKVFGYTTLDPIFPTDAMIGCWYRKGVRMKRADVLHAVKLTAGYGFDVLKLHRVTLSVPCFIRTINRIAVETGFKHEGTLRQSTYYDGKPYDTNIYSMLREDLIWEQYQQQS